MFAVCLEASHQRGLGHLYRGLNLVAQLVKRRIPYVVLLNDYPVAVETLRRKSIPFRVVSLHESGWEAPLIKANGITVWINDRLATNRAHAAAVKGAGARLVTFDDRGGGAGLADLHVAALYFGGGAKPKGNRVVAGTRYLILNPEIERLRRIRTQARKLLVTLGGTDTYGVTVKVVELLKRQERGATVVVGPGFEHLRQLQAAATPAFAIKQAVPSLIEEFATHDVAITGGGVTAFEAAASGLPCIIVANERFEVPLARHLENLGCALYAGHHSQIGATPLPSIGDVEAMSRAGISGVTTRGAENVYRELAAL